MATIDTHHYSTGGKVVPMSGGPVDAVGYYSKAEGDFHPLENSVGEDGPRHRFTDAEAKLLMDWHMEAKYRLSIGHALQASKYSEWEVFSGMPCIVVCTVAATMAMGTERTKDGEVFKYFLCILSVIGTILSFIFANTQFSQRYEQHKSSWTAYSIFGNDAEAALARHAAGDRWFHAQQHLDMLYERWKELKGPSFDIPALPEPTKQSPPATAELVVRRWMLYAEHEMMRHQYAAQSYDIWFFAWRAFWMMVAALCSAASLGTFLPRNTEWYIAFSYISLLLNIFAVIIMAYMNFCRYPVLAEQHQLVADKCRALHDRAAKLLAQRLTPPNTSGPASVADEHRLGDAIETLRTMLNDISVHSPLIPTRLMKRIDHKIPVNVVLYSTVQDSPVTGTTAINMDGADPAKPARGSDSKLL